MTLVITVATIWYRFQLLGLKSIIIREQKYGNYARSRVNFWEKRTNYMEICVVIENLYCKVGL